MDDKSPDKLRLIIGPFVGMLISVELYLIIFSVFYYTLIKNLSIGTILNISVNIIFIIFIILGIVFGYFMTKKRNILYEIFCIKKENLIFVLILGIVYLANAFIQKESVFIFGRLVLMSQVNFFEILMIFTNSLLFFYPFASILVFFMLILKEKQKHKSDWKLKVYLILMLVVLNPIFIQVGYSSSFEYQMQMTYKECGIVISNLSGTVFHDLEIPEETQIDLIDGKEILSANDLISTLNIVGVPHTLNTQSTSYIINSENADKIKADLKKITITQKMCKR